MTIVRKNEGETYTPPGHDNSVCSRKMFNPSNESLKVDMHVTTFSAGAGMDQELHEKSDHIFYMLSGKLEILRNGEVFGILGKGDAVHIAAGEVHQIRNGSDEDGIFMAITAPPLSD